MKTEWKRYKKRIVVLFSGVCVLAAAAGSTAWYLTVSNSQKKQEREGMQAMSAVVPDTVTVEGSVSVGTVSQTFEMDLSEFTDSSQTFSWQAGMDFPQMNAVSGGMGQSAESRQLTVEEVYVAVGEEVSEGEPILKVTDDTLETIRQGLSEDVSEAQLVYEQALTQQKQTEGHLCHSQLIEPGTLDGNKIKKNKQKNSCQKQGSLYPFQIGSRFSEDTV